MTEPQQLGLASQEFQPPGPGLGHAPLDVAVLLGGNREEHHTTGQVVEGLGVEQAHGRPEQPGHLCVVAAGVRGTGLRVGDRVAGDDEGVELAEQREGGTVTAAAGHVGPDPGERQTALGRQAQTPHRLLDQAGGLHFLEAELGVPADRFAETDDLLGALVDGLMNTLLQLGFGHGFLPGAPGADPDSIASIRGTPGAGQETPVNRYAVAEWASTMAPACGDICRRR